MPRARGPRSVIDFVLLFLRVAIITTLWIGLFLATFFGYLTAPFIVLVVFIAVYAVVDRYRGAARRLAERRRALLGDPVREPVYENEGGG